MSGRIQLAGFDGLFGGAGTNEPSSVDIKISEIVPFANHPFPVRDDGEMQSLIASIRDYGVLSPVLVRKTASGKYEMISGHRRMFAAKTLGLTVLPAIIRDLDDDEATIIMVDSNIQREELLPSEKAFALKMKMDALKHQGVARTESSKDACDEAGESKGLSGRQAQRYVRLASLKPDLLKMVDDKKLQLNIGSEVAGLRPKMQGHVLNYLLNGNKLAREQLSDLKDLDEKETIDDDAVSVVLTPAEKSEKKFSMSEKQFRAYFPADYTSEDIEEVVISLLERWMKENVI